MKIPFHSPIAVMASLVLLSGCANFSADGGMNDVAALTKERTGQIPQRTSTEQDRVQHDKTVRDLLSRPLTPDSAVQIALINNPGLQARLSALGVAESDLVQAGRMRNPGFSFGRLSGGGDVEIDRSIMFDLVGLLTIPLRSEIERGRFEQAKLQAAIDAVKLAAETRRAFFYAVAAQQTALFMEQVKESAEAGAELALGMRKAGNWNKLDTAREQIFYAESIAELARSRQTAVSTREQLTRTLGLLQSDQTFTLPAKLPDLPKTAMDIGNLEAQAMQQRLDVQMAKRDAEATASALGLSKVTRFINVLDAGYMNKSETGKSRSNGYEISVELPLFDWGSAKSARTEALYMQSLHRTADIAVRARSEVRESYAAYRSAYELSAHYRDQVVPLRKQISEEMLLRYNGMLSSVFELLADARLQISAVNAAISAQRDYWLAESDLQMAINGSGPNTPPAGIAAAATTSTPVEH
ncbi:TolC family protein [Herminiimonas fonticola]|uniref:Outer membrane protein TolC n=1 Tax=Herminiimonas fonticola TaxID=303380 RepID=A0A4R6G1C1_9BURK|nr:TolC family protein [Herminiimonas fonticola]RBA24351.1 Outer membrane efflux protein [Herminiimonas fonticola]TDN87295.1 outer membrane protein TolC [Herminiimonas fonticola]